jgi:potassium-dependent mechanosensitive channel
MRNTFRYTAFLLLILNLSFGTAFAQTKNLKIENNKREIARKRMHTRDSLLRSITKSDTSINGLLQRVEQYAATYNQIYNSLAKGLDTADISRQLPPVIRGINKIDSLANTHKSSTLRYLFVLNDYIDHMQDKLDGWQDDLTDINSKLVQYQSDLMKFSKDTLMKIVPADSTMRQTYFAQRKAVWQLWRKSDSLNRVDLLRLNLMQDKISVSYNKTLDESDEIATKIKNFAVKAIAGESDYIWNTGLDYPNFKSALSSTIKLNNLLFDYFTKSQGPTHLAAIAFLVIILTWIFYTRGRALKNNTSPDVTFEQAPYIYKKPLAASLLIVTAIAPYFYDNPPEVFLEVFFLLGVVLTLFLTNNKSAVLTRFLSVLLVLAFIYAVSNLFIEIANIDRFVILGLSVISIITGYKFYKSAKANPDGNFPQTTTVLKIFLVLQILSLLLNITGRFSLAKIIGVTAVFNLWELLIFYVVIQVLIEGLYLQFQIKKGGNSFINWMDLELVKKRFRSTLLLAAALLWLFILAQNLNIDDWAYDYFHDLLIQPHTLLGATFEIGGFVTFIIVIWLSSIVSRLISYLFDVSAQRGNDLSALKKKNRTSTLIIRMAVFTIGFLLAVAFSGFPLDKLTIIISAFGVGIGFGLQNIVNNLVSGLILAFEKPIQIGDVVEIDGASGTMQEIGIRSSKILTGDGSEVIIPNGDLISHHVINWTLSNTNRQVAILVHTAYGVDIDKVKELLKGTLKNREDIMTTPAPGVFINNVTEGFVEFKVLFWVSDVNTTAELKSRIFINIFQVLKDNNIPLPAAQKDFNLYFPGGNQPINIPIIDDSPGENPDQGNAGSPGQK